MQADINICQFSASEFFTVELITFTTFVIQLFRLMLGNIQCNKFNMISRIFEIVKLEG